MGIPSLGIPGLFQSPAPYVSTTFGDGSPSTTQRDYSTPATSDIGQLELPALSRTAAPTILSMAIPAPSVAKHWYLEGSLGAG